MGLGAVLGASGPQQIGDAFQRGHGSEASAGGAAAAPTDRFSIRTAGIVLAFGLLAAALGAYGLRRWKQHRANDPSRPLPFEGERFVKSIGDYEHVSGGEQREIRAHFWKRLGNDEARLEGMEPEKRQILFRDVREQAMLDMGYPAHVIVSTALELPLPQDILLPPLGTPPSPPTPQEARLDLTVAILVKADPEFGRTYPSIWERRDCAERMLEAGFRPGDLQGSGTGVAATEWREIVERAAPRRRAPATAADLFRVDRDHLGLRDVAEIGRTSGK